MGQGLTKPQWHMHPASSSSRFCPSAQEWDSAGHLLQHPAHPTSQERKDRKTLQVLFGSDPVAYPAWGSRHLLPAAVEGLQGWGSSTSLAQASWPRLGCKGWK